MKRKNLSITINASFAVILTQLVKRSGALNAKVQ